MTSTKLQNLQDEARKAATDARAIIESVSGRDLTTTERADVEGHLAKGRGLLEQIKALKDAKATDDAFYAEVKSWADQIGPRIPDGDSFAGGPVGRQIKGREWATAAAAKIEGTARQIGVKALVSGSVEVPNPISVGVVAKPDNPTRLIDMILEREKLTGNEFTFLRQTVRTNNADTVADFGTKPTSVFTFAEVEDRARVIAHLSEPIPERYFTDHLGLLQVLESEMFRGVSEALESQVISGGGTGEDMTGILTVSGTTAVAFSTDLLTTLRRARTAMQIIEEVPTAWVFSPEDAEDIDLLQDNEGKFFVDGQLQNVFGGLPKLVAKGLPAGQALLADWNQARLFVREDIRLDADRSGTNFTKNQVVLRAEGRFGFALLRPQAFAVVDLTA